MNTHFRYFSILSLILFSLASASSAAFAETRTVNVRSGQTVGVAAFYIFNRMNCKSGKAPKVSFKQPKGGTLLVKKTRTRMTKGVCKGKSAPAIGVYYKANRGFKGKDKGRVIFRFSSFDDSIINKRTSVLKVVANVK